MADSPVGTPLPTTNSTASAVANTVGEVVKDTEAPVEAAIIVAEPWMGTVVLVQIWETFLNIIFAQFGNFLGKFAGYVVIDVQQYLALTNAVAAQVAYNQAVTSKDANAISQASTNLDAAVAPCLHYIGAIQPK